MSESTLEPLLSVVIPVRDEGSNIRELAADIGSAFAPHPWTWECLWIDDGSTDDTLSRLQELHAADGRHAYVSLDGGHGQTAALVAGFRIARGKLLATLDGDGQNDPADLPAMTQRVLAGEVDMVLGVRVQRHDDWIRKMSSRIGNGFRNWITGESITDVGCSIRVFRRECVAGFPPFEGLHRFFPTLLRLEGWSMTEVAVRHRPRRHGETKYGIHNRLWKGLADACAVRWMLWRHIRYRIAERAGTGEED